MKKNENNLQPGDKWLFKRGYDSKPGIVLKSIIENSESDSMLDLRVKYFVRFLDNNGEYWTYAVPLRKDDYKAGYKCYNGAILNKRQVDAYNEIQKDINRYISQGVEVPERLITWSHKYFWMVSEISKDEALKSHK